MKKNLFNKKMFILSPLFILVCLILAFWGNFIQVLIYISVVAIHELAHFFTAKKRGYKLKNFYLMPYGVCLNFNENIINENDEVIIALAGPMVNLFFVLICIAMWWCFPSLYYYTDYFCFCNMILALFNLMPCFPLDGGRVLVALLSKKFDRIKVKKATLLLNYIVSFCLVGFFILSYFNSVNFTFLFISIFLFSGTINPNRFSTYNYVKLSSDTKKLLKSGTNIKFLAVDSNLPIYKIIAKCSKSKFNIIYIIFENGQVKVLSEFNLYNLSQKYPCTMSIKEIIQSKTIQNVFKKEY